MDGTCCDVIIVGGGPAGLRAAELVSAAGLRTVVADHKPSVGRKFLVAGRGGLNLTHSEPVENFPARYGSSPERWQKLLADFSPDNLRAWGKGLGIETFIGTSGRVFPESKQAAPLLRRWIERLRKQGVTFRPRHELTGFRMEPRGDVFGGTTSRSSADAQERVPPLEWAVSFISPQGEITLRTHAVIFALGGASWPQTGSDGSWVKLFPDAGIPTTPLTPANCGYEVDWPATFLIQAEGLPLKNIAVTAGEQSVSGELLITKYGLEGGAIYQLGRTLRGMKYPAITIDLKPAFSFEELAIKLKSAPKSDHLPSRAARAWRLAPAAQALLEICETAHSPEILASLAKSFPLALKEPRPIAEAISTAGGIPWAELDDNLMLKRHPGLFCAGEMIDWDAPTGGYLLQGCFSTATRAARGVRQFF